MLKRELSNSKYQIDALDGLRGVAALIVILSHTSNEGWFFFPFMDFSGIGKSGVYLFFLLSSFLLTIPLYEKREQVFTFSVMANYWQRRFFRIYPLFLLYLLCALMTTHVFTRYLGLVNLGAPFPLDMYEFIRHVLLIDGKGVTWSIAVEFKFYFVLPILIFLIACTKKINTASVVILLILLFCISQYFYPQSALRSIDTRLMPYMPIFLIGVSCALIQSKIFANGELSRKVKIILHAAGTLGFVGVIVTIPSVYSLIVGKSVSTSLFHKEIILVSVSWAAVMMYTININSRVNRFFSHPILRLMGTLSFSLYLIHPVFIGAINFIELNGFDVDNTLAAWSILIITTLASLITFKLIEEPTAKIRIIKQSPASAIT